MTRHLILTASAFGLLLGMGAPVSATKPTPPGVTYHGSQMSHSPMSHQGATMSQNDSIDSVVAVFPQPAPGMTQFVINLPSMADESAHRVGIMAGKMQETDGINSVGISGQMMEKSVQGWGYNYFEVKGGNGPAMTTLMGVPAGTPRVTKFVSLQEKLVRYNSQLPLIVYAPDNFEVRYRVFAAGSEQSALTGPSGGAVTSGPNSGVTSGGPGGNAVNGGLVQGRPSGGVTSGGPGGVIQGGPGGGLSGGTYIPQPIIPEQSNPNTRYNGGTANSPVYGGPTRSSPPATGLQSDKVVVSARRKLKIPQGSTATVRLYDGMMNGPEDSFASHTISIDKFPATLTMPPSNMDKSIAMPSIDVSVYGPDGVLLYVNEQMTIINFNGPTKLRMAEPYDGTEDDWEEDEGNDFE